MNADNLFEALKFLCGVETKIEAVMMLQSIAVEISKIPKEILHTPQITEQVDSANSCTRALVVLIEEWPSHLQ